VRRAHCAKEGGKRAAGRSRRALWAAQGGSLLKAANPGYDAAFPGRRSRREAGGRHFGLGREARAADVGGTSGLSMKGLAPRYVLELPDAANFDVDESADLDEE
jgi:hypothetical protein